MVKGQYTKHRENQRETLLNVAEDLFIQKGIEPVTIEDIVKAARITRPTLYKYFSSKEEMAVEIFKLVTAGWIEKDRTETWAIGGTGYERVERFVLNHFNRLLENPRETSFIAEFNHLYAKQWTPEQALAIIHETLSPEETDLRAAIFDGQRDGSIRSEPDPELLIAMVFNFNSAIMSRMGDFGSKIDAEFDLSSRDIFMTIARFFLDGLKNTAPSGVRA